MISYRAPDRRSKSPLVASLILHFALLFLLLTKALLSPTKNQNEQIQPHTQQENEPWATTLADPEWAEQIAGSSQFGTPIMLHDEPELSVQAEAVPASQEQDPTHDQPEEQPEVIEAPLEKNDELVIQEPLELIQEVKQLAKQKQQERKKDKEKHQLTITKPKQPTGQPALELPQVTLADITRGFLNQMGSGNATMNSKGKTGAQLPAEQIQYQRFMQKIHWCIQNSFNIHRSRLNLTCPAQGTIKMGLILNRNGRLHELQIIQSCGNKAVDDFMYYIFKEAGDSFPPVPKYITGNQCPFVYNIDVNAHPSNGSQMMMTMM